MPKTNYIGAFALVFIVVAFLALYRIQYKSVDPPQEANRVSDVAASKTTVTALLQSYKESTIRADLRFKNRVWEISGAIARIETNWLGQPVLRLRGDNPQAGEVYFICQREEKDKVAQLRNGGSVTIRGIGQGRYRYGVKFSYCIIVPKTRRLDDN